MIFNEKHYTADKRLGQHFLFDLNITRKIIRFSGIKERDNVLEIGPGPGGLTITALEAAPRALLAVDSDIRAIETLAQWDAAPLHLLHKDAMEFRISEFFDICGDDGAPIRIISNLPYNISVLLLMGWLEDIAREGSRIASMTLMFQKEVAERITAAHGSKSYGKISVYAQYLCDVQHCFNLPASAFSPPPKVDSSVLHFHPRPCDEVAVICDEEAASSSRHRSFAALRELCHIAFQQRRKTLRNALKSTMDVDALQKRSIIDLSLRPDAITPAEYISLARAYDELKRR